MSEKITFTFEDEFTSQEVGIIQRATKIKSYRELVLLGAVAVLRKEDPFWYENLPI